MLTTKNMTVGRRMNRLLVISIVTAMASLAFALSMYQFNSAISARRAELEATGYVFASAIGESIATNELPDIQRALHATAHLQDIVGVYALDAQDRVLANSGDLAVLTSDVISGEPSIGKIIAQGLMPVRVDVVRGGEHVGHLLLIGDVSNVWRQIFNTLLVTLISAATALTLALLMAHQLQQRITTPIVDLTRSIVALHRSRRYELTNIPNAEGETRTLVESFNGMIGEIQTRDTALKNLAYFDALTGLPNRASFQQHVNDYFLELGDGVAQCAILLLDIDNFKAINDTLGQVAGDALLLNVAALLRDAKMETDFVARIGGDEFAVFVIETRTPEQARAAVAPFIATLYHPMKIFNHDLQVSACAGLAISPEFGPTSDLLQRNGRLALSQAKHEGVGRVISYRHEIGENLEREVELERGLRAAIAAQELEIYYQPIVSAKNNRVEGFEALLRWRRHDGTVVPPSKFIPLAEKAGLIAELGLWVLKKACKDARAWLDAGHPERFVSVNVSPSQILLSEFVNTVREALDAAGLPPELLCLEVTESLFIGKSTSHVRTMLLELKSLGVVTALDDFGTGYSSLSYLEHLPFDKLKIDRAFVHKKSEGDEQMPLLRGIASLAHALGIAMVAEGAETLSEVALLRSIGVQSIQGYFFARPMPVAQALEAAVTIEGRKTHMVVDAV